MATAEPEAETTAEPEGEVTAEAEVLAEATAEAEVTAEVTAEAEPEATSEPEALPETTHSAILTINNEEDNRAEIVTMVLPALIGVIMLLLVVVLCSMWQKRKLSTRYRDDKGEITRPWKPESKDKQYFTTLLSAADLGVLYELAIFPYCIKTILIMCLPAILSLAFLPVGTIVRNTIIDALWPDGSFHTANINDVISCFLLPAGLVYAIAFGFAFQQAASSQTAYHTWLVKHYVLTRQQLVILDKLKHADVTQKMEIIHLLKNSVISCCMSVLGDKELHTYEASDDSFEIQSRLCDIKENIESASNSATHLGYCDMLMDMTLNEQMHIKMIDTLRSDMNACLWTFLELLGYFAFIGILLVDAKSYRMELAMCFCTVFSISMFSFILGDLDHPFHGLFRVDLAPLLETARLLEVSYIDMLSKHQLQEIPKIEDLKKIRSSVHVIGN